MILTITAYADGTVAPSDIGYVLHKNPDNVRTVGLAFGRAHVVYPVADDSACSVTLLAEVDPVALVRNRRGPSGDDGRLDQYVNDRPYVASSFLSTALARLFNTAMGGRCEKRPELVEHRFDLEVHLPVTPARGGEAVLRNLFEPLGYTVFATQIPLDTKFPSWGDSRYFDVRLRVNSTVKELLEHLYVLLPVLDNDKHYWIGMDEVEKLLRKGGAWLKAHPARDDITRRYLRRSAHLTRVALARLTPDEPDSEDTDPAAADRDELVIERPLRLNTVRTQLVCEWIVASGAKRVMDVGCGEGKLVRSLLKQRQLDLVVGVDVSHVALERAAARLKLDRMPELQRRRVALWQGSLVYKDSRLSGFDACTVVEVIEHLELYRLPAFERTLFEFARPRFIVITTPNREYNVLFEGMEPGAMRHRDHRFEWSRAEFRAWATQVSERHGYAVKFEDIGELHDEHGAPTQAALFTLVQA